MFWKELEWYNISHVLNQFQDRVNFKIQEDLEDLMNIQCLSIPEARAVYEAGYVSHSKFVELIFLGEH